MVEEAEACGPREENGEADDRYSGGMTTLAAPDSMCFLTCQMLWPSTIRRPTQNRPKTSVPPSSVQSMISA
jgi:hypothetical protein